MKNKVNTATIAKQAEVGLSTAGFILSGKARSMKISVETEQRVLRIANKLGYIPNALARSLRSNRSGIVGVLYNHLKHHWADGSLNGIRGVLSANGYAAFLSTHQFDAELQMQEIDLMLQHQFDAIICIPFKKGIDAYKKVLRNNTPLIFLNDSLEEMPNVNVVAWNAREAAALAMQHLISLGRKKIAYFSWEDDRPMFRARVEVYEEYLKKARLPIKKPWIRLFPLEGSVEEAVRSIFSKKNRPDAIFAGLDVFGIGAIGTLEKMGFSVPKDVALVGMGDQPGSNYDSIGLSSVVIPSETIGAKSASLALDLVRSNRPQVATKIFLSYNELIIRRSSRIAK